MPTEIGQPYPVTWEGRFPHLLPEDVPTWLRFLAKYRHNYIRIYYDVRIGGPDPKTVTKEIKWGTLFYRLKAFRIDALCEATDHLLIAEITGNAGVRAVGQALVYRQLWLADPKIDKPARIAVVCSSMDSDIATVLNSHDVSAFLV